MNRMIYFPDGSSEAVYGSTTDEIKYRFSDILENKCGLEAAQLFQELALREEKVNNDDYERISDGYYQMLNSTVDELDAILESIKEGKRLNRDKLYASILRIRNEINSNI